MAQQSQRHSLTIMFLIYGRSLLSLINLAKSLFRSTMVYSWSLAAHQNHTFRSNAYHLLLLIVHFLETLSLNYGYLTCIFGLSMIRKPTQCKILDI